jgi:pentatricopeptide repeat protein
MLEACATEGAFFNGKHMHTYIINSVYESDVMVVTPLFNMYHSCNGLEEAQSVFSSMVQHDVISWTAVIATYAEYNQSVSVIQLFQQMLLEGVSADDAVYVNILAACADEVDLVQGKIIHTQIVNNDLKFDISLGNALVNMYGKCGSMMDAHQEFQNLSSRDVLSFNIMINGFAQHGHGNEALLLYEQMLEQALSPNEYTFGSILAACSHAGFVEEGYQCMRCIIEEHFVAVALEHFDCMVDILGRTGRLDEAEGLLVKMPMQPIQLSWMTLLGASRIQVDIDRGKQVSQHIFELGCGDASPYVALSNLYAVVDRINDSESIGNCEGNALDQSQWTRSCI